MWYTVRLWPVEFDPAGPSLEIDPPPLGGNAGADAPWRHEPSYWGGLETLEAAGRPEPDETTIMWRFDLGIDQVRELDERFRARGPDVADEVMDRALAPDSPVRVFRFLVTEWP